ncbi:MAG TPA: alpha/beta fold hydrolase [Candidatus Saccharimonadales bacterium]|nr:alpha/beta fold hydrolase [Candidatus Saccharimonadales bacterium]
MQRVIFIHGNGGGSGQEGWFPWCKQQLEKLGVEVLTPDFPDAELARAEYWLPFLEKDLNANEHTILVGHSSGAVAALRYAETHKIGGSVLVGVNYTDLGYPEEKASGYYDAPWNWQAIKANQPWVAIFASTDDPYIPIAEPRFIRDQLGADYHEFTDQGHFGQSEGSGKEKREFPELLDVLKQKLSI